MRIAQALDRARELGVGRLDAQILLARCVEQSRVWLIAHDQDPIGPGVAARFLAELARRAEGEPLAYLVGEREFHGLRLSVNRDVLVPRPETELLVDWALELLMASAADHPAVIDLGTGSGAIALAVKQTCPRAQVTAVDLSERALEVARRNAACLALDVEFVAGDWWSAVPGRRFDLVLANPPYIAGGDPHLAALSHEPISALSPGGDGLDALRAIITAAPDHLSPGAPLLLEHGHDQAQAVSRLLAARGFENVTTRLDLAGLPRCSAGTWRRR